MAAPAGRQLRLLLWKDYLVRKRNFVTLGGILWATAIMMGFYVVRINIDNQDFPSCQYSARALPSAGVLTFVQSFVCSVDNQCRPLDQFQEIPAYENSKLSRVRTSLGPLLSNGSVLEVAGSVPGALKLLATLARVLDEPTLIHIAKNGLKVQDLFVNPSRVRRHLAAELNMSLDAIGALLAAPLDVQGIMKPGIDRCNVTSISSFIRIENKKYLESLVGQLCRLTDDETRQLATSLMVEVDYNKYITMAGAMYHKLSGDGRVTSLASLARAATRMATVHSYLPPVLAAIFERRHVDFSYFDITVITKLMDEFEPTFGKTKAFQIFKDITDTVSMGLEYLDKIYTMKNPVEGAADLLLNEIGSNIDDKIEKQDIASALSNAIDIFEKATAKEPIDVFTILSQVTNFINKLLPDNTQHDVQFYATLLAKLIEGANKVVSINWDIKEMAYEVSLRNAAGIQELKNLPLHIVTKGFEALADAERVQILSSKINVRGQIFCDANKMANFFKISKKEADSLKTQLCTDAWKNYMGDMIQSFGIYDVRDLINNMASLVVQETFGKDTTDQLYSIDKDFQILKNFTDSLNRAKSKNETVLDWSKLFNVTEDSELMKVFGQKANLGKQILITVHGALAKEVVKQNAILEFKLSPFLLDLTTAVQAINTQLQMAPEQTVENMKRLYPTIVRVMLDTVMNENKTYLALSTPSSDMVCSGTDIADKYLELSTVDDKDGLVGTLCNASRAIDEGLNNDSVIAKAIATIRNSTHGPLEEVNWSHLITGLKDLYVKLDAEYPYLFEFTAYRMGGAERARVEGGMREAKQYWFNTKNIDRGLHLSVKLVFRLLDLIDSPAFNIKSQGWLQGKTYIAAANPPLRTAHALFLLLAGASRNESLSTVLPVSAATALSALVVAAPHLLRDTIDIVVKGGTDVAPLISLINSTPPWPCGPSFSDLLPLGPASKDTVKAAESLMCVDDDDQDQWNRFISDNHLKLHNVSAWNTTTFPSHLFLKFSGTFDAVVDDIKLAKELVQDLISSKTNGSSTLAGALEYAADVFQRVDRNDTLKALFANIDVILNTVSTPITNSTLSEVWAQVANCSALKDRCRVLWRAAWKQSLQAVSIILDGMAGDLLTYFTEINEPDVSFVQLLGFTRGTGLFVLLDRLPEFVGALLNSFWDYGFMTQVRRASMTQFWECEAVLTALVLPAGSKLDTATVDLVRPIVCPSLLYWLSMPRGANTFLDIVAKPQYTLYNMDVQNLTSHYESAFTKATHLALLLKNISNKNDSLKQEDVSISSLENRLQETVNSVLNYKINETNPSYRLFNEINKKQFISATYLTRVTAMVNKLAVAIENLNPMVLKTETEEVNKLKSELATVIKIFKRRPHEAIAFHFDVITDLLAKKDDSYDLVNALEATCNDIKNNGTSKDILNESQRTKNQICAKDYKAIYGAVQDVIADDLESARNSLVNMVSALQDGEDNSSDLLKFFKNRKKLVNSLRISVKYVYDLGLPIYLKYLQSNLQSYKVVLSFLSGGEWWAELKAVYSGPRMVEFYAAVESSCDIALDVLTQLDKIQIVRLLRDIELNNTSAFCFHNVSISDYVPDGTGLLSRLKQAACADDTAVFKEIPPLVFASQGFGEDLTLSKDIDYASINTDISQVEFGLRAIRDGPRAPRRPAWVTDEGLARVKAAALGLVKGEALTKATFGLLGNIVDAGTLFLNNSQCSLCSQVTTWVKQINLQLYKKQEYHSLLCHLDTISSADLHRTLKDDFHWDMAFKELISSRNYTKLELNKSLGELLELVKLQVLEEVGGGPPHCGDSAPRLTYGPKILTMIADTITLFRAELPYLHEVEGIKEVPFLKELHSQVAPNMDVYAPVRKYLNKNNQLSNKLADFVEYRALAEDIENAVINLRLVGKTLQHRDEQRYMKLKNHVWSQECKKYNCKKIIDVINQNMNTTLVDKELPKLQSTEFWTLSFISDVLQHVALVLKYAARLATAVARLDVAGAGEGRVAPTIDFVMELLTDETLSDVIGGIQGILEEVAPLLNDTSIASDLRSLTDGLLVLQHYKNYLAKEDIRVPIGEVWSNQEWLEEELRRAGFNNTQTWRAMHSGHIALTPLLSWKSGDHISSFVCQVKEMSRVIFPGEQGPLTRDEVLASLVGQFCGLSDRRVKELVPLLLQGMNYTYILDKVTTALLSQLYTASNLTQSEGEQVSAALPRMATVLPSIQAPVGDVARTIADDPLMQTLRNFTSIGGLLESVDFMSAAGNMLCGRPFSAEVSRVYRGVLQNKDTADEPDEKQLAALPTEYCRSLYSSLTAAAGGKLVWSFLKPLLLGKLLYTPPTARVLQVIRQANSTFAFMANLTELVHSFAGAFSSVEQLSEHRQGVTVLRALLSSAAFEDLRTNLVGEGDLPDVKVEDMFDDFGDLQGVGDILRQASSLLRCISLDRFRAAPDEPALEHQAAMLAANDEFSAGLVFLNNETNGDFITNVRYKIRMDIDNAPTTARLKNYLWIPGPEDNFLENMRYFRGFVQIQDMVDRAIIEVAKEVKGGGRTKREVGVGGEDKWAVYTQQMPYPCYRKDFFQTSLYESQALIVAFLFSLLFTVASAVRFLVADADSGNTMLMAVMGVRMSSYTLSWALWSLLELVLTYACVCCVLCCGAVLPRSEPALLATLLLPAALSVLGFCYMMSKLFSRASVAAVCSAILYLVTFMPVVIILSLEAVISKAAKLLVCLSMSSALCYAFVHVGRYEAAGVGAKWDHFWAAPTDDDVSMGLAAVMMLVDAVIYFAIGYTIDYFFGLKTLQSCISHCKTSEEKAGVSIVNVSKEYGRGSRRRRVLDNVSVELQRGQITTLLGHNGAGKTTLINILTGMLKPTRGHVVVRSEKTTGGNVGVCPQRDVLFSYMTPREHIALYAQLQDIPREKLNEEVDSMLQVLSLGPVSEQPVCRLSGGTRRRVCVALAFVGRGELVMLDEPTSGVDPAARRAIWSLIVRLRGSRAVLLTTHHLHEAELLSDHLVILHQGQVHTTGTPIEIKRTLGHGYRLSVTYPDQTYDEDDGVQERTKQLLATTREVVANASVASTAGLETEITLPFYDSNGVSNDFLRLCCTLESRQQALGFNSYALDCSSLEHVLHDICHRGDYRAEPEDLNEAPSKSTSSSSTRTDSAPLVAREGPATGPAPQQLRALLRARYLHYSRDRWSLAVALVVPALFVCAALGFSCIRPPPDNEAALPLAPDLYNATDFLTLYPSIYSEHGDPSFAASIMLSLMQERDARNWTEKDTPTCECGETRQMCTFTNTSIPHTMVLPNSTTLNDWIVKSHDIYVEKRYGGFASAIANNMTNFVAWYNNKGHHALPSFLSAFNSALLKYVAGNPNANITTYSHPMKISKEQLSKDTVYQHIADAGISGLVLLAYCLVSATGSVYLVTSRALQEKRLQLLSGVPPALYWGAALVWDMLIIVINMLLTAILMEVFQFPVFVARSNLPAICLLILLYGFACSCLTHVAEKLFTEPSVANMLLFCGNAFLGLGGLTVLLILDLISQSEKTDNARWVLHKIFMLAPPFALGDGMLEIAKNTIQAQVLSRFGMETYRDPLTSDLIALHLLYLALVGIALFLLNLAIEYQYFDFLLEKVSSKSLPKDWLKEPEDPDVAAERRRVEEVISAQDTPLRLHTIGNINAGFVDSEGMKSPCRVSSGFSGAASGACCVGLGKIYPTRKTPALWNLTLAIPAGQCTALLGENGAGKSTTFSLLTGALRPSAGRVLVRGAPATRRLLCTGHISYCPQNDALDPLLTVEETLSIYCQLRGIQDQHEVIKRTMELFELTRYARSRAGALSGGNRRKLCTALALMSRAPLVLLDEPTSGMDPVSRGCVARGVRRACSERRAVLLSTHQLHDARRLATTVALLRRARLRAHAPTVTCLARFGGGYVVECRVGAGHARAAWRAVRERAPAATMQLMHHAAMHFLLPATQTVNNKEVATRLSDIFRLMAELQASCDVEDYTVNQSSLDQMFLSFSDNVESIEDGAIELEPLPSLRHDPLASVTAL